MSVVSGICDRITVLQRGAVLAEGSYAEVSQQSAGDGSLHGHAPTAQLQGGTLHDAPHSRSADLHAWYGESHVLHGIDLAVQPGEVVALLGRNGAGRTTTLRAIMGLTGRAQRLASRSTAARRSACRPHRIAHLGVGYCPEERGIFASAVDRGKPAAAARRSTARAGHVASTRSTRCSRTCSNAATARARACPAASSRCWRWRASCAPARGCCCSTRSPKAWRR